MRDKRDSIHKDDTNFLAIINYSEVNTVYLNYDAKYAHASESCGGGFIYWKENQFHWLQVRVIY